MRGLGEESDDEAYGKMFCPSRRMGSRTVVIGRPHVGVYRGSGHVSGLVHKGIFGQALFLAIASSDGFVHP